MILLVLALVALLGLAGPVHAIVPFGPFHHGEATADYSHVTSPAYSGAFLDLGPKTAASTVTRILADAATYGRTVIVNLVTGDPCVYWDGQTFDQALFLADAVTHLDLVVPRITSGTVAGVMLLNEPHNPTRCRAVPPSHLYVAAKALRAALALRGVAASFPLGFGSGPVYLEAGLSAAQAVDGTVTLSFIQWTARRGPGATWAKPQQDAAARMSAGGHPHRLIYSVNSEKATDTELLAANTAECQFPDALQVWWWRWNLSRGPETTITLARWQTVRAACDRP